MRLWANLPGMIAALFLLSGATAPRYLRNLSAGTKLVARRSIRVPANEIQITLSSESAPGASCRLRMKESKPFDRMMRAGHALQIANVTENGLSAPRRIRTYTHVQFDSESVNDIVCVSDRGRRETTFDAFARVVASDFKVELPSKPPAEIDGQHTSG